MDNNKIRKASQPDICRCCLLGKGIYDLTGVYSTSDGKEEIFGNLIRECLGIELHLTSTIGSRVICNHCLGQLRQASYFRQQVLDAEQHFLAALNMTSQSPDTANFVDIEIKKETPMAKTVASSETGYITSTVEIEFKREDFRSDTKEPWPIECSSFNVNYVKIKQETEDETTQQLTSNPLAEQCLTNEIHQSVSSSTSSVSLTQPVKRLRPNVRAASSRSSDKLKPSNSHKKPPSEVPKLRLNVLNMLKYSTIVPFRYITRNKIQNKTYRHEYTCQYCEDSFYDFDDLKKHHNDTHENLTDIEIIQNLRNCKKRNITDGYIIAEISDITCKICKNTLKSLDELFQHLREHKIELHDIEIKPMHGVNGYLISSGKPTCHVCSQQFQRLKHLMHHMVMHDGKYQCNNCGKFCTTKSNLLWHMSIHDTLHRCKICKKTFETQSQKNNHVRREHDLKLPCPDCNEKFKNYDARRKHIQDFHTKDVLLSCHVCDKVFNHGAALKRHIRRRHLRENFVCDLCGKNVTCRSSLLDHRRVAHSDERPFSCNYCQKMFKSKKTLTMHIRGHLNDKRYVCEVCDAAFVQITALRGHYKAHHPGVPVDLKKSHIPQKGPQ